MAQFSTSTRFNRYPEIFRTLKARIAETRGEHLDGSRLKILSFGCSLGAEVMSLRCYFPDAWIFGCDIDRNALRQARRSVNDRQALIFESSPETISEYGPFDVILAMSVLCRWGLSRKATSLDRIYPFDRYTGDVAMLDRNLRSGGLLVLYNTNHLFRDAPVASSYGAVRSNLVYENGFVDKWDRSGQRLTRSEESADGFEHKTVSDGADVTDSDFLDCIFEKGLGGTQEVRLGLPAPEELLAGPRQRRGSWRALEAAAAEGRIVSMLDRATVTTGDGPDLARLQWIKSGVDGKVIALPPYWRIASDLLAERAAGLHHVSAVNEQSPSRGLGGLRDKVSEAARRTRHHIEKTLARWR